MSAARTLLATLVLVALVAPMAAALAPLDAPALRAAPAPAESANHADRGGHAEEADDAEYQLRFVCPERVDTELATTSPVCPDYVLDHEDIFGQPILLVDPRNPEHVGFSAMHGGRGVHPTPNNQPPSERSRANGVHQPHTTFRSTDGGSSWQDMPYYAPDALASPQNGRARDVYGEANAATLDADGRIYLAALYATREGSGSTVAPNTAPFSYAAGLWKAKRLDQPVDYNVNLKIAKSGNDGANKVDGMHLAHVPQTDVVVLVWREEAPEGLVPSEGNASSVVLHWTRPEDGALWTRVETDVGPCRAVSTPIAVEDTLFVGCLPPRDEDARDAGAPMRVHAIDTRTWKTTLAGEAPIFADHVLLVKRHDDGYMVAIGSGLDENRQPVVHVSYGERGARWSSPDSFGADLTRAAEAPLLEARVTAAAYAPRSGHLHLIYMERYDLASVNQDTTGTPEFWKTFASIMIEGSFQTKLDLGVGALNRLDFSPTLTGAGSGAFNDLHDSIVIWDGPGDQDREFVAYGDHGYVRFAEVVEDNYPPVIVPFGTPVPPVPLPAAGVSPLLVGLPAGLLAGAAVARTIAARRQAALEVGAE